MAKYTAGDLVTVMGSFYNTVGVLTAPTTVTLKYSPAGSTTVTTETPTEVSTGIYTYNIDTTGMGPVQVIYEFIGTGACQTQGQNMFELDELPF
jgi:hypothetical protein